MKRLKIRISGFAFFVILGIHGISAGYINDRGLGTDCLYDEDCTTRNSFCKGNKICTCKIGYQYDAGSDICFPKEVNLKCDEDYDCSALPNAKCINNYCKCKNDYVPSIDKSSCLPSMRITSICEEDAQCTAVMNGSYCDYVTRQCVCGRGLRRDPYRLQCLEKSRLHSQCLYTDECIWNEESKGRVECRTSMYQSSTCECREGYVEINEMCQSAGTRITGTRAAAIIFIILRILQIFKNFLKL